jgi:glycosyltransferase involved in cell wall biosynthesis
VASLNFEELRVRGGTPPTGKPIVFVSTIEASGWGGSEELWSRSARLLAQTGIRVHASVSNATATVPQILELAQSGVVTYPRASSYPFARRVLNKTLGQETPILVREFRFAIAPERPALVVFSDGGTFHPIELLEECASSGIQFVTLSHVNHEDIWPDDTLARRYRRALGQAKACFFVSDANRALFELQIGCRLRHAEVVRNPFNVSFDADPAWPRLDKDDALSLASVGRLHPSSKGQHILLQALSSEQWHDRSWNLSFYGDGPMRDGIARLIERFSLADRVFLKGHVDSVERIWAENHVLVMPSRYEGLPLAVVEAMLCHRPVVATNVAGHSEVVSDGLTGFLADAATPKSVAMALERMWQSRAELQRMGIAGGQAIRSMMPRDPVSLFANRLMQIAQIASEAGRRGCA